MINIVKTRSATAAAAGKKGKAVTSGGSTRNTGRKERVEDADLAEKSNFFEDDEDDIGNTLHVKDKNWDSTPARKDLTMPLISWLILHRKSIVTDNSQR